MSRTFFVRKKCLRRLWRLFTIYFIFQIWWEVRETRFWKIILPNSRKVFLQANNFSIEFSKAKKIKKKRVSWRASFVYFFSRSAWRPRSMSVKILCFSECVFSAAFGIGTLVRRFIRDSRASTSSRLFKSDTLRGSSAFILCSGGLFLKLSRCSKSASGLGHAQRTSL